jgi:hypothetical protein
MRRSVKGILILPFFLFISIVSAQVTSVSPYSRLGLGDRLPVNFTRSLGFGSASMGLQNPLNVDISNPASYSALNLTTFEAGLEFTLLQQQQDNPAFNVSNNTSGFRYLTFGIPLTDWWGTAAGLKPYSFKGYNINTQRTLAADPSIIINDNFSGEGGLNRIFWGNSFEVASGLSLGLNFSYLFGSLSDNQRVDFQDNSFFDTRTIDETQLEGILLEYGAQYTYYLKKNYFLGAGLALSNASKLNAKLNRFQYTLEGNTPKDTLKDGTTLDRTVTLPGEFKFGLSYGKLQPNQQNPAWAINLDYEAFAGSQFEDALGASPLVDGYAVQFGAFFTPRYTLKLLERNTNYFNNIEYRVGAYYENTPISLAGTQITDYGITFGLGLPIRQRNMAPGEVKISTLNIGARLGRRGTLTNNLIQEEYLNFYIGITLNDKWFIDYKYR